MDKDIAKRVLELAIEIQQIPTRASRLGIRRNREGRDTETGQVRMSPDQSRSGPPHRQSTKKEPP